MIRFGPAGLGGVKEAVSNLEKYAKLGLKACEIAFTYSIYIKESQIKEIEEIRDTAKKLDISLSIHAPYYINLNSKEKKKIEESKKRILDCCKIGDLLGAREVVFHPGYYGNRKEQSSLGPRKSGDFRGDDKETTYKNIKKAILDIEKEISRNKWKIKLAPETTGKINVFGSTEEILKLAKETKCSFTLDFAHIYARSQGKISYKEIYENFRTFSKLHCHFSGINFSEKGERSHKATENSEINKLLRVLPKDKEIVIINESPNPVRDSVKSLKIYQKL